MADFDFQPKLTGELITMRPMAEADFEPLYVIASDPLIWAAHPVPELCQRDVFRKNIDEALSDKGGLVVVERTTGEMVGYSRFSQMFSGIDAVEMGWSFLARRLWGGAHNRDMKRIMLIHALATFPRVIFRVGEDNIRSRRAMEKIGGPLTGWRQEVESFGRIGARIAYEITRDGFAAGPLSNAGGVTSKTGSL